MDDINLSELFQKTWNENPKLNFLEILDQLRDKIDISELGFEVDQRGTIQKGEYYTPRLLSQFIEDFVEDLNYGKVLDPFSNFGELLFPLRGSKKELYGINPHPNHVQFVNKIFQSDINWKVKDPLESIRNELQSSFDLIVSSPPFGFKRGSYEIKDKKEDKKYELRDSYGNVLILESLKKLDKEGAGIFVVPESSVTKKRDNSVFDSLEDFGFYMHAAISIPSGTFSATSISTLLLIIKKEKSDKILVGKLAKDSKARKALIENFRSSKEGEEPHLGAFVPRGEFKTVDKLIKDREVKKKANRRGLKPFPLSEITKKVRKAGPDSTFEDKPNAIYFSEVASGNPAAETFEEYKGPERGAIQLVLDEAKVSPDFVASFLNTKLGNQLLKRYSSGSTIPRISVEDIRKDMTLFLPKLDAQKEFMRVKRKIEDLENQLGRLTDNLWKNPYDYHETESSLEELNLNDEELFKRKIEQIPFPLGSILWAYQASNDPREEVEHLHNFFEATSEFITIILLSAFKSKKDLSEKSKRSVAPSNLNLSRASFGTWVNLGQKLAKETRILLNDKNEEFVRALFGGADDEFISSISNKELFRVLDKARKYRNDWKGHDGYPTDEEIENRHQQLQGTLQKAIDFLSSIFKNSFVINPKETRIIEGTYNYSVSKLEGYSTPFEKENIETIVGLEDRKYYLYHKDKFEPLELLPLFKVMESPKGQKNTCYFYNKLEGEEVRFVSYQYDTLSEQKVRDGDILSVIDSISLEDS